MSSTTKRRGALPGNQNALKHGFYSRRFRELETNDLDILQADLLNEIAGLRVAGRRILEYSEDLEDDPQKCIHALSQFGLMCTRIARLSRDYALLTGGSNEKDDAISIALARVVETLQLDKV